MLTQEQVLKVIRDGRESKCLDGRDYIRLADFFADEHMEALGFKLKDGVEAPARAIKPWTREAVLDQLARDVDFGFEKALNKRGISASLMHEVVEMWMWVLEDEEFSGLDYAQYGLPLLKAVAVKYGFDNPIGDHAGDEHEYSADG